MSIRVAMIAIGAAASAAAAGAQPDKNRQPPKATKPAPAAPVVLASASEIHMTSPIDSNRSAEPVRRPAPRVTTCRCGDPQPDDTQPDE
jgi:lipoprotein-anchoring transpeptidase ErfK/SrfK